MILAHRKEGCSFWNFMKLNLVIFRNYIISFDQMYAVKKENWQNGGRQARRNYDFRMVSIMSPITYLLQTCDVMPEIACVMGLFVAFTQSNAKHIAVQSDWSLCNHSSSSNLLLVVQVDTK